MPTNVWYTKLKMLCALPYLKSAEINKFIHISLLWSRNSETKPAKARHKWPCVAGTPASPAFPHVTNTFQRNLNFHTPVVLLAQLEGLAWPFSPCPVGIPFDISGDPRAEWENRMRSWLQGSIWSQSWVMVRADAACEDSFRPTEAIGLCQADCSGTQAFTSAKPWTTACVSSMSILRESRVPDSHNARSAFWSRFVQVPYSSFLLKMLQRTSAPYNKAQNLIQWLKLQDGLHPTPALSPALLSPVSPRSWEYCLYWLREEIKIERDKKMKS